MNNYFYVVHESVFCCGFVSFLNKRFPNDNHFFLFKKSVMRLANFDQFRNICYVEKYIDALNISDIMRKMEASCKIIISGLFDSLELVNALPDNLMKKTYIQLWGADIYSFLSISSYSGIRPLIKRHKVMQALNKSQGVLTLINGDYDIVKKILKHDINHFTLPVPPDPLNELDVSLYRGGGENNHLVTRVLVGNSATKSNCHLEVFKVLKRYCNHNIEVVCPLSYGDMDYRQKVINKGKEIFGQKFIPLCDFYCIEEYATILSGCKVAIFNNNRQQAMGNLHGALGFGLKVYISNKTSMWDAFNKYGYKIFDFESAKNISFDEFVRFNEIDSKENSFVHQKYIESIYDVWKDFLAFW